MIVKNLQEFLENFTSKKGNAITDARIYVEKNGYLEEIRRMEVHESRIIGQSSIKLVVKTQDEQILKIDDALKGNY
jgi:hypothetical protein|tara:strand:+ start:116 stop:343 length:228 start_codon:yes stop_codon:yes gene_type:complete